MSVRALLILTIATVIACAVAANLLWTSPRIEANQRGKPLFAALSDPQRQVDGIEIETPDYHLQLQREHEGWAAISEASYPARKDTATGLVTALAGLRRLEPKTRRSEWFSNLGVEDRQVDGSRSRQLRLLDGDEVVAEVLVGKTSASLGADPVGGTFVRIPGDRQSWLVSGVVDIPASLEDWFEPLFNIRGPELRRITISVGGRTVFDAWRDSEKNPYALASAKGVGEDANAAINGGLLQRLERVLVATSFTDVRPASEVTTPVDARTVRFESAAGLTVEARLAEADGTPWVTFYAQADTSPEAREQAAAIAARTEGWAFRLPNEHMLALKVAIADLTTKEGSQDGDAGRIITDPSYFRR